MGEQPYLGYIRIIGYIVWVYIFKEKRKKLDKRSKKCYLINYEGINIFRVWNSATKKVERVSHIDFDELRMMTAVVSNIGYWLAKYIGDNKANVFDIGGETIEYPYIEHPHIFNNVVYIYGDYENLSNIDYIRNILNDSQNSIGESGDIKENDIGVEVINDEDVIEILFNSPETYPDLSIDIIYTSLPKRVFKLTSKILLNKKWGDIKM